MASRIVLISGANTGLGLEIVKALCGSSQAYTILLGARSPAKASAAIETVQSLHPDSPSRLEPLMLDVESDESIAAAAAHVEKTHGRLDVLVNNAGAQLDWTAAAPSPSVTLRQMWNKSWDVNVTGAHLLTHALAPALLKSSKPQLLFVTSGTSSIAETENAASPLNAVPPAGWPKNASSHTGFPAYRSSKAGLNMLMREWTRVLKNDGVRVWAISPGLLATGLGAWSKEKLKQIGAADPAIGGSFVRDVIEGARDEDAGKVIRRDMIQPW